MAQGVFLCLDTTKPMSLWLELASTTAEHAPLHQTVQNATLGSTCQAQFHALHVRLTAIHAVLMEVV